MDEDTVVANNLDLAVEIADAARTAPERPENVVSAARTLTACHPEADASLDNIADAIRDQWDESLPASRKAVTRPDPAARLA